MKLLIDNCIAGSVIEALRAAGHDIYAVREHLPDPGDLALLERAAREGRAIVTIDSDFGALVYRDGRARAGVLRLRERRGPEQAARAATLIAAHEADLRRGAFVTDDGDTVRVSAPRD